MNNFQIASIKIQYATNKSFGVYNWYKLTETNVSSLLY